VQGPERHASKSGANGADGSIRAIRATKPFSPPRRAEALLVEELRRLHEGVLARYGLRPSEFTAWKQCQGSAP